MVNTKIRLITFFAAEDGEALYSQQKQDQELNVAQIMNSLLQNSDLNGRKQGKSLDHSSMTLILYSGSDKQIQGTRSNRVPEEWWTEVYDTVQEAAIKTIPKKKKCKKAKWLSEEVKGKGEKERYVHLNAEFQRIARRDKKVSLSDQW